MDTIILIFPTLLMGAQVTLTLTVVSVSIGCVIGLFAGLARLSSSRLLRAVSRAYVEFFRGTPLLVQALLIYFGMPHLIRELQEFLQVSYGIAPLIKNPNLSMWTAAITVCSLNSGAYIAEIFRAGVQSIERGQMEAARSLGMNHAQAMRYVILPQAFKRVLPPLGNEFIMMLKDTAILSAIGFVELTRRGQLMNADMFMPFHIYMSTAFIYLVMTLTFSRLVDLMERRLKTG